MSLSVKYVKRFLHSYVRLRWAGKRSGDEQVRWTRLSSEHRKEKGLPALYVKREVGQGFSRPGLTLRVMLAHQPEPLCDSVEPAGRFSSRTFYAQQKGAFRAPFNIGGSCRSASARWASPFG